jgi:hypothetical protein
MEPHTCMFCDEGKLKDPILLVWSYDGKCAIKTPNYTTPKIYYYPPIYQMIIWTIVCIRERIKQGLVFNPDSVKITLHAIRKWKHELIIIPDPIDNLQIYRLKQLKELKKLVKSTSNNSVIMTKSSLKT